MSGLLGRLRGGRRVERRYEVRKPRPTLIDIIDFIAINYLGRVGTWIARNFELEDAIRRAGMTIYPQLYAARVALATFTALFLALYLSLWIALSGINIILKAIIIVFLLLTPILVFAAGLAYPALKISERKEGVDTELPFFAAYLATMARARVPVSVVLTRVAELKIFNAMRREAQLILRNIKLLGKDPLDAVEDNAIYHPSFRYRDLMLGYTTTVKVGGDVVHYLEIKANDIFESRVADIKLLAERMSLYTEIYITIAVIATIAFYIFFTISSVLGGQGGAFGGAAQIILFAFVFLPIMTLIMLYIIHKSQPKTPVRVTAPHRAIIYYSIPLSLALGTAAMILTGTISAFTGNVTYDKAFIVKSVITLDVFLLAFSLPPAITYIMIARKHRGLGLALANFLRDLTEVRKTGLSPERSIESVSVRDYGPLNPIVRRMATSIRLGLSIEEAVRGAVKGVKDWVVLATMRFLVDSIELGGGSPEVLETLARFAYSLVMLEEELKRRLRVYIFMPYLGAILVTASSIIVLSFIAETLQAITPEAATGVATGAATVGGFGITLEAVQGEQLAKIALLLLLGSLFNSWLMGIVAGKIRDGTIASGFIHASLLLVITSIIGILAVQTLPI